MGGYKIRSITLPIGKILAAMHARRNEYYLSNTETKLAKPEFLYFKKVFQTNKN